MAERYPSAVKAVCVDTASKRGRARKHSRLPAMSVFADLVRYRELYATLFRRDFQSKYKGSLLGVAWSLANPLVLMLVYYVVFSVLWKATNIDNYPLFLLSGLATWVFFSQALQASTRSMIDNAQLIRKTRFPRQLLPFSVVGTHLITLCVMLAVLVPLNIVLLPRTRETALLALPVMLLVVALTAGLSLALASLNVLYRDIEHLVSSLLLPWFFLTPILYTVDSLPQGKTHPHLMQVLHYVNFIGPAVDAVRDPLFWGKLPNLGDMLYLIVAALIALTLGAFLFRRLDDRIAVEL